MSNGLSLGLVQMAYCRYESISVCRMIMIYSQGSYENILVCVFLT